MSVCEYCGTECDMVSKSTSVAVQRCIAERERQRILTLAYLEGDEVDGPLSQEHGHFGEGNAPALR